MAGVAMVTGADGKQDRIGGVPIRSCPTASAVRRLERSDRLYVPLELLLDEL
jgi:hypothetical protein